MLGLRHLRPASLVLFAALASAAHASGTPHWVHYKLLQNNPSLPKNVVVMAVNVEVIEMTAGDVEEEVPEWSAEASANVDKAISEALQKEPSLKEVKMPKLSGKGAENVEEHMALYKLVVNTASGLDWSHKIRRFDYGIGDGLASLQRQTGADTAILVFGQDYASTAGRKAKAVVGSIPILNILTGPAPELGHSYIHVGAVDLKTGDLLWMNSEYRDGASNLRNYEDAQAIIAKIFEWYPGIEEYRKAYVQ